MKKMCSDYTINHLNFSNYKNYITDTKIINIIDNQTISITYKSDLIRTYLMYKYGGVYLDSSILLLKPINKIIGSNNSKIIMYKNWYHSNNNQRPILENWFIASPPHKIFNKLILETLTQFLELEKSEHNNYLNNLLNDSSVDYQKFKGHGIYHISYFIYIYIQFKHNIAFDLHFLDFKDTPQTMFITDEVLQLCDPIDDEQFNNLMKANLIKFIHKTRQLIEDKHIKPLSFMHRYIQYIQTL